MHEDLDDAHRATAFRTQAAWILLLLIITRLLTGHLIRLWCLTDQTPDPFDPVPADAVGEEARVTDAVEAGRKDRGQDAPDDLIRGQAHDLHPVTALDAVIFPSEGHGVSIGADQAMVRDRHAVRLSAEMGQPRFRPAEGWFGIDCPIGFAQRREMRCEGIGIDQL